MIRILPPLWSPYRSSRLLYPRPFWRLQWSWMTLTTCYGHKLFAYLLVLRTSWFTSFNFRWLQLIPLMQCDFLVTTVWWHDF